MVRHVAIILDGNRRYAKKIALQPWKGHEYGAAKVRKLLDWCAELNVRELTLYTFSMQNFNRTPTEVNTLMKLFVKEFDDLMKEEHALHQKGLCIRFIGRLHLFPAEVQERMQKLMEQTKNNNRFTVNFAMAYGGREEIVDAAQAISKKISTGALTPEQLTEETISQHLYLNSEPDIVIRTGGDQRTSNFLIWQSNYAEWFFLNKTWPEFEKEDLERCINEFNARERRFGT